MDIGCKNTVLNWTCPGGYLQVQDAKWKMVKTEECINISNVFGNHDITMHMKNRCDNKTSCSFLVNDASFGVPRGIKCTGLIMLTSVSVSHWCYVYFKLFS
jgi:hypothetical protein